MKRILKVLLVALTLVALTACQSEELDAASIYQTARGNMLALDSFTMETSMDMSLSSDSEDSNFQISMSYDMTYVLVGLTSESLSQYIMSDYSALGVTYSLEKWYIDGIVFIEEDGYRYIDTAEDFAELSYDFFSVDDIESITAKRSGDGYALDFVIDSATFMEFIGSENDPVLYDLFYDTQMVETVNLTMQIDGDNYITGMSMATSLTVIGVGTLEMSADYSYSGFNSSSLPDIDPENFIEYTYSSGEIYGDYDLTIDYAEDLIALGYEDSGNYTYSNGTYTIDLLYKQIFTIDAIYDWEYDVGGLLMDGYSDYTCFYDFTSGYGDTDYCDVSKMQSLRDAYNELASSILE